MQKNKLKVAIVHDILNHYGGAERVVESFLKIWPEAQLFTSRYSPNSSLSSLINRQIKTTFMQKLPFYRQLAKYYTPLFPLAFELLDLSAYDLIVTSTAHFAKGVITRPNQLHICYCHTPPRFLYHYPSESKTRTRGVFMPFVMPLDWLLRQYDYLIAQRPDHFLTNSETTAARIRKFYRRPATVIYPPVDIRQFHPTSKPKKDYFLVVSRLVQYKNVDTVVEAFNRLGLPLNIVGTGPEKQRLEQIAYPNVKFLGFVANEKLLSIYQQARAVIFSATDEDFGIVPVEAMAAGVPVIAFESGGVKETVIDGKTGILYRQNTCEAVQSAVDQFQKTANRFDAQDLAQHANNFSEERFIEKIEQFVSEKFKQID